MPINPTTLKTLIDTQITNETANLAITPAEVGGRMKDTIDYTTEQIATVSATPDATTTVKGKVKLAGDLAGTADLPTVPGLAFREASANKSTNVVADGASDMKYPSVKAVKTYADGLVVGLLDDRGNYNASSNTFPATGGSGSAGAVLTGDLWFISVAGTLGGVSVPIGASVRALVDAPAQTSGNWSILNVGLGFTPENVVNKSTNVTTDGASDVKYPSVKAIKDYVDNLTAESYTNKSTNVVADGASDTKYPSVKAVKDYVDANSGGVVVVKVIKVSLSSADILALKTSPKLLIPAVGGTLLSLNFIYQRYTNVSTPYVANGNGQIRYGSGINNSGNQFSLGITTGDNFYSYNGMLLGLGGYNDFAGMAVYLSTTGSINPSGGDGTLDLYIEYTEITL